MELKEVCDYVYKKAKYKLPNDAEDIAQEVAEVYLRNEDKVRDIDYLKPWLNIVLSNKIIDLVRKRKYEAEQLSEAPRNLAFDTIKYTDILDSLDDFEKELITKRVIEEMSWKELSDYFNRPMSTLKRRLYWIKERLRQELK